MNSENENTATQKENAKTNARENSLLSGPILRNLILFAIPVSCSMLAAQLYSLVDSMIIGRFLDANALAAVSNSATVLMVFLFISGGMELGCGLLIAAKQPIFSREEMSRLLYNLLFLDLMISLVMVFTGLLSFGFWLKLIRTPEGILSSALAYGRIYLFFLPLQMVYDVSREMMIGMGDSKSPLRMMISTSVMNVVLDLIMVPLWGVAGAAIATGLAQAAGFLWILLELKKKYLIGGFHFRLLTSEYSADILRLAPPNALQQASGTIITMIRQSLLGDFGAMAIAGFSCSSKTTSFLMMPLYGFTQALVVFTAQNEAAGNEDRIHTAVKEAPKIYFGYSVLMAIACFAFARQLIGLYTTDAEAISYGLLMLTREPASQILYALRLNQEAQLRGRQMMGRYLICNIGAMAINILTCMILVHVIGFHAFYISSYISGSIMLVVSIIMVSRISGISGTGVQISEK